MVIKSFCIAVVFASVATASAAQDIQFAARQVPHHSYTGGWEHFVGGGVAVFDCDGDLFPELYAAGGADQAQLLRNRTAGRGDMLRFEQDTPAALALSGVVGAYPLDIDGDGVLDLAILRVGKDVLLQGQGGCDFAPFAQMGFDSGDHWTTAFSATWEDGQDLPTLAFGTYVDRSDPNGPFETCDDTLLYRPQGANYGAGTPLQPGYCALSMLFTDWSRTGRADLRVSNDRHYYVSDGQEQMWAMQASPRLYASEDGWQPFALWGMGIASRDVTGDGFADVFLTSMGDQKLQYFAGETDLPLYRDVRFERGSTAHRPHVGGDGRPSTGWHAAFGDVNNDGLDDLFIAKGNVEQMPDAAMRDPNNLLVQQPDGVFAERAASAGIASFERSRGAALVDLNLDGRLDLAVVNRRAALEVFENQTSGGNWALLQVQGQGSNGSAVGAHVELRAGDRQWVQEITVGGGHAGGHAGLIHVGLGQADQVQARLILPRQAATSWFDIGVNQITKLTPKGAKPIAD